MMNSEIVLNKKDRIGYLDALRGIGIILVVFLHVEYFSFYDFEYGTFVMNILQVLANPLFFFISGFVSYKEDSLFDARYLIKSIYNKIQSLILPTVVIGLFYTCFHLDHSILGFWHSPAKYGYWFTISLFEMFFLYYHGEL